MQVKNKVQNNKINHAIRIMFRGYLKREFENREFPPRYLYEQASAHILDIDKKTDDFVGDEIRIKKCANQLESIVNKEDVENVVDTDCNITAARTIMYTSPAVFVLCLIVDIPTLTALILSSTYLTIGALMKKVMKNRFEKIIRDIALDVNKLLEKE